MDVRRIGSGLLAGTLIFGTVACSDDEDVSDEVGQLDDEVGDGVDDLGDDLDEGADDLGNEVDEGVDELDDEG